MTKFTKDNLPSYSVYEDDEKPTNFIKAITNKIKLAFIVAVILGIGFATAYFAFEAAYYADKIRPIPPSKLMPEACYIQLPFRLLKDVQREISVQSIIEDGKFPKYTEMLRDIQRTYDHDAETTFEKFSKEYAIRSHYYQPDPLISISTIYFFSTLIALLIACRPFDKPSYFIQQSSPRYIFTQCFRGVIYSHMLMLYVIGIYKLIQVFKVDCTNEF